MSLDLFISYFSNMIVTFLTFNLGIWLFLNNFQVSLIEYINFMLILTIMLGIVTYDYYKIYYNYVIVKMLNEVYFMRYCIIFLFFTRRIFFSKLKQYDEF